MLTWRGSRLILASGVWLTLYVFCILMVGSFIFFEVLDVDGSDFVPHPSQMDARVAESHHDDLKRLWLQQPLKLGTDAAVRELAPPERSEGRVPAAAAPRPPVRQHRVALPRAALVDVPPSA